MSPSSAYTSRVGEVPCGDMDLYAYLTDMRNFRSIMPPSLLSEWNATTDDCSFRLEKIGRITAKLLEAMPHSMITYEAENMLTGKTQIKILIEFVTNVRSRFRITASLNMNPFLRMIIGDTAQQYLDRLVGLIEQYEGFEKIRGYNQSP